MIEYKQENGNLECVFLGRMDTPTTIETEKDVLEKIQGSDLSVTFNLKQVDFVSSCFLRLCLRVAKEVSEDRFAITNMSPQVTRVFKIAGFENLIKIQ